MTLVHYIRQAARPIIQVPARTAGEQYLLRACGSARIGVSLRPMSTTTVRSYAPSTKLQNDSHVSPFKKQRQTELLEEIQNEDSLFDETHPRLQAQKRMSVPEFIEKFHEADSIDGTGSSENTVTVCGRVRSKRVVGKNLLFIDIVNEFQRLQVMVNRAKCMVDEAQNRNKFLIFRNLIEVGDHISITGIQIRTKAGELTLEARALPELLSPAMEQIPEKLTDPKTRMQDRHVDMLVNREVMDTLRMRSEILKHMREHFHSKRFLEFQTPILAENAGGAIARPFVTQATEFRDRDLAMRIAPELWLKRLVIGGVDKVFEIGPSFRNEGVDATHNPEFTMCEFYSAYSNLEDLIKETEELLCSLAGHASNLIATQLTSLPDIDLAKFQRPFKQVEFIPALEQAMDIRMPKLSAETAMADLLCILKLKGIHIVGETPTTLSKLLDRLAAMYIEPMSFEEPVFIINHPQCMSPLAKSFLCPKTYQLVSARAELFINGRELANMYEEENNPEVQKQKLSDHRNLVNRPDGTIAIEAEKETSSEEMELDIDGDAAPLDQSFVRALDYGLPPTGGWGCGVERLVMLFSGANRITDCLSFGTLRNVVGLSADEAKKTDKN